MSVFDLCVIGGGPSGYAAAMRAIDLKKKVLLIEKSRLGGAGVHNGALSSKTWWELSKDVSSVSKNLARFNCAGAMDVTFDAVAAEVKKATTEREMQLQLQLEYLFKHKSADLFTYVKGEGRLTDPLHIEVTDEAGEKQIFEAHHTILATGSRPRKLPDIEIDEKIILTSDGISELTGFPESMVILGAGVIGCEFATIFSNFGKTKVFLIDKTDRILPFEDEDVAAVVEGNLKEKGVAVHRNSSLVRMEIKDGRVEYELSYADGYKEVYNVEKALISVGRVPNIENTGAKEIGVKLNARNCVEDDDTRTSVPNIYAVGDLTADIALVNVGELEGRHAVEKMFAGNNTPVSRANISTIMFLSPETAGVGINETEARAQQLSYKVVTLGYATIPRSIAMRNSQGFFKILVTNDAEMKILGMRVVGVHASSAIQAAALLIQMGKGIAELAELIHPHPSIIEGVQECARMLLGTSILKPEVFGANLQCKSYENGVYKDICHF